MSVRIEEILTLSVAAFSQSAVFIRQQRPDCG
jgi:hypothetical protein